ncbi:hypothetical protein [Paenarthrobacter ureafaciens]|uniref:hypothetical protein n=1 Tax=Paenarthrobacter ureafaciens TaxID=37931 RepID=UPI0019171593|nr:hypothetical protein [Paenarthrobacter ureafaciens]QQQ63242.1 hypothetical protein JHQ56_05320 [Paenarthrobacter ureafaciens]UOD82312.1 hypothetical protein MQZ73_05440 [Paenarthrobacter ureafaciens]WNZ05810.1 hypothetical protein PVT25_09990 [Paenarthrobacter ureafaciens]
MTISVGELFGKTGLEPAGVVRWRTPIPLNVPGVYVVASTASLDDAIGRVPAYRPDLEAFRSLRKLCPNPTIDGVEASDQELADRIGAYWIPESPILYVGLAGTSVRKRVGQYYATGIGKRSPHAGGWWLKTLADLENLYVHYAAASDPQKAEKHLLSTFAASVPATVKEALHDNERIAPFANIDAQRGLRKRHGLQGVKLSRIPVDVPSTSTMEKKPSFESEAIVTGRNEKTAEYGAVRIESQVITEGDRIRSNLRIPSRSKYALPANDGFLNVVVRGVSIQARWRVNGSRSGTIGLGNGIMRTLGTTAKSVWLRVLPDAVIVED